MKPIPHPSQPVPPSIETRQQLDSVVENIVQLQLSRTELESEQDREIVAIRQRYRAPLAELDRYLLLETTWVETWANAHPDAFSDRRTLPCTHAIIGFRTSPPRVERLSRKWSWSDIAVKLAEAAWGRRYLRHPAPEVNKEAVLSDRLELDPGELKKVGLKILQDDRFFIHPHQSASSQESLPMEEEWPQAA